MTLDCIRCPALVASRQRIVPAYGVAPCRALFVGEAPGYAGADTTGIPFTRDKSGRRLQALLIAAGLSAGYDTTTHIPSLIDCAITNIVRCHPAPPGNPMANRAPTRVEIANCAEHLDAELRAFDPLVLVPIGGLALGVLCARLLPDEQRPITQLHATWLPCESPDRRVQALFPMRHPSRGSNAEFEAWVQGWRLVAVV